MSQITHKILVNKYTGKIVQPVHEVTSEFPEPPDCVWKEIVPGTHLYGHFCVEPPEDLSHLDINESYFNFQTNQWVEVASTLQTGSIDQNKKIRNDLLKQSDVFLAEEFDPEIIQQWIDYRAKLRAVFDELADDFDHTTIVWPRTPRDIAELKKLAAAGDEEAIEIINRDGL